MGQNCVTSFMNAPMGFGWLLAAIKVYNYLQPKVRRNWFKNNTFPLLWWKTFSGNLNYVQNCALDHLASTAGWKCFIFWQNSLRISTHIWSNLLLFTKLQWFFLRLDHLAWKIRFFNNRPTHYSKVVLLALSIDYFYFINFKLFCFHHVFVFNIFLHFALFFLRLKQISFCDKNIVLNTFRDNSFSSA